MPRNRDTTPRISGIPMIRRPSVSATNPPSWFLNIPELNRKISVESYRTSTGRISHRWTIEILGTYRFIEREGSTLNGQQKAANAAIRWLVSHSEKVFKFAGRKPI